MKDRDSVLSRRYIATDLWFDFQCCGISISHVRSYVVLSVDTYYYPDNKSVNNIIMIALLVFVAVLKVLCDGRVLDDAV